MGGEMPHVLFAAGARHSASPVRGRGRQHCDQKPKDACGILHLPGASELVSSPQALPNLLPRRPEMSRPSSGGRRPPCVDLSEKLSHLASPGNPSRAASPGGVVSCAGFRPESKGSSPAVQLRPPRSPAALPRPGPANDPATRWPLTPQLPPKGRPPTPPLPRAASLDAGLRRRPESQGCDKQGWKRPERVAALGAQVQDGASPARLPRPSSASRVSDDEIASSSQFNWEAAPWLKSGANAKLLVSVAQDQNEEHRSYMEDGHQVVDPLPVPGLAHGECWRFFAVFDGHGGHQAMEWLQIHLHHLFAAELQLLSVPDQGCCHNRGPVVAAITKAFRNADKKLASLGAHKYGSTATVALVHESPAGKMLYVANVGDSRAVLIGGMSVKQLSVDHHTSNPLEAARVERDGGCIFRKRVCGCLSITRALGDHDFKGEGGGVSCVPDVSACKVLGRKVLVLASDGLWDVLNGSDVQMLLEDLVHEAVQKERGPEFIGGALGSIVAHALVERAKKLGSHDNICAVVAFL